MMKPKLKICGITRMEDVKTLNACVVDYAGFVFYKNSPRYINGQDAAALSAELAPTIQPVAVFVSEHVEYVLRMARRIRATVVQAHGRMSVRDVRKLQKEGLRVAVSYNPATVFGQKMVSNNIADFVLLDNSDSSGAGGVGSPFDWSVAPRVRGANIILAGGLNSSNFRKGARLFRPVIIDVNSGVERSPGVKSRAKIEKLVEKFNKTRWRAM